MNDIDGDITVPSPRRSRSITLGTRNDTNDGALVAGIVGSDEYGLGTLPDLHGTAIDIGAHIGTVALCLAADHPDLRVIAVEVVPENCAVLRHNIETTGYADRVSVVQAAAAEPGRKTATVLWNYRSAGNEPQEYVKDSRYIAGIYDGADSDVDRHRVKAVSLDTLMADLDSLALLKIDCEGCEWAFLRSKRVADIKLIIGEFHNNGGFETLRALIGATHDVQMAGGSADIGLFRAVAR